MMRFPLRGLTALIALAATGGLIAGCGGISASAPGAGTQASARTAAAAPLTSAPANASAAPPSTQTHVDVKVLAINDFHGNLLPAAGGIKIDDPQQPGKTVTLQAGGSERIATLVQQLRAKNPNHTFVAAGDLIGASPLLSALFHDEPTIESLSAMGLEFAAVGNHEFDKGVAELLRRQRGGCHPKDGCLGPAPFTGAKFQYLAASTVDLATQQTILPAYRIKRFEGVPVAFVGLTLKDTPNLVSPNAVAGVRFDDEAETVNRLMPELERQGVQAVVVMIHEGGVPTGGYNECPGISGPIVDIVRKLDRRVGLVVSGHTHRAYNCQIDGRLVTSGDRYGTIVTEIDLQLDRASGRIAQAKAQNLIVRMETPKDPVQTALIAGYEKLAGPIANKPVGRIAVPFTKDGTESPGGGTPMGQLVADAMLAAMDGPAEGGAQMAMTNIGGVRTGLVFKDNGIVTYGDLFAALPFSNALVVMEYSGAQLQQALEQQWTAAVGFKPLQVSRGFSYAWDGRRPIGQRVVPGSLTLNGKPITADQRVRVVINSFLQAGGDGFAALKGGRQIQFGPTDVDALEAYVRRESGSGVGTSASTGTGTGTATANTSANKRGEPLKPSALDRMRRVD